MLDMVVSWLLKKLLALPPPKKNAGYQKKSPSWPLAVEYRYIHLYKNIFSGY